MIQHFTTFIFILFFSLTACSQNSGTKVQPLQPKEFQAKLGSEKGILLDVRTPGEYKKGHLKGARLLNIFDESFEAEIAKLDSTATYFVYCASGGRSSEAAEMMEKKGFRKIYDLDGGFGRWKTAGMPLEQ